MEVVIETRVGGALSAGVGELEEGGFEGEMEM